MTEATQTETIQRRLEDLEVRLTFIDDTVSALSVADAEQSVRIAALERLVRELRGELMTLRSGQGGEPQDEIPPHY